jgi:alpha-L-rhamnosidase
VLDGGYTIKLESQLGDLEFVEGTFPTKYGVFKVNHKKDTSGKTISFFEIPKGLKVIQK